MSDELAHTPGETVDERWLRRAMELAAAGPWPDPNPRVGCVIVDAEGTMVAEGFHRGSGTPHAEAAALALAGDRARGATAYVSLEPCTHTGRTGPCVDALVAAGVARVVFGQPDPNPAAAGGGQLLREAGVEVVGGVLADEAAVLNERWTRTIRLGRPLVTWKLAATLDGRSAAADGTSQWITGPEARADVHALRATRDAVVVGTGTLLADDPQLTARMPLGDLAPTQPLRVVMGLRAVPDDARVHEGPGDVLHLVTRDPHVALIALWEKGIRDIWLEGGPTLAAAFVAAGLVDEVYAYLAPALLGAGRNAVADLGIASMSDIRRLTLADVRVIGTDVRITGRPAIHTPDPTLSQGAPRSYSAAEHLDPWGMTD
ncbi:MAG TPA: bifunctional diaminohydroxyphosphoribosylaminopyrimidine deaminase/5-amino-6-(5-phosphoribosylamino)uracil reductase RibD [Intrasporangium sp.]|uniref:bifunctional diaminohydroxyphosphoribosylaminopyrimidine deaminase/5-amino-6-(5-phosphoribosylamino)uracil reductase RibD n=1 Tax=Intrasporangium sp. TaxID=1925024 RepID=UPI002D792715|nr:bifunctional diaminohydroxyphosphoribosylaminopyrimidine deaminase/5-amino-6-(5-phosphoribosylamino)uracil reductase RibD [Intrasporangium sp.]HET7397552.1 bifunctional diaminohydroxyphosphoribosylaminopyrimidine deaminase/5-amino-6-(5-phosphoribosylamino)uracil reductase RibD [Intrasporangium sp.]